MSEPGPPDFGLFKLLRARLNALAKSPRARTLAPELPAIVAELLAALDELDDLARRVAAGEGAQAELARLVKLGRDPGDCD